MAGRLSRLGVLFPGLENNWDSQLDNQGMDSTSKSSHVSEVPRKYHRALSTPRKEMMAIVLNASRADSSRMDKKHHSEGQAKRRVARENISNTSAIPRHYL